MKREVRLPPPPLILSEGEGEVVNFLLHTEPFCIENEDWMRFVRRLTAAGHHPQWITKQLRAIILYCASHPRWERERKDWALTITNWIRRETEQKDNAKKVGEVLGHLIRKP